MTSFVQLKGQSVRISKEDVMSSSVLIPPNGFYSNALRLQPRFPIPNVVHFKSEMPQAASFGIARPFRGGGKGEQLKLGSVWQGQI